MVTTEQIKELTGRREGLRRHLAIEDKLIELDEEQARTLAPDFWDRPEEAEKQLRKVAGIKSWIDDFQAIERLCDDLELMPDFVREGGASEEELDALYAETLAKIEALEMRNMLRGPEDRMGAIMDINSGAGGTESLDWASMLLRMYTRWGELNGYKVRIADLQPGEEVGIKSATIEFEETTPTVSSKARTAYTGSSASRHSTPTTNGRRPSRRSSYRRRWTTR